MMHKRISMHFGKIFITEFLAGDNNMKVIKPIESAQSMSTKHKILIDF